MANDTPFGSFAPFDPGQQPIEAPKPAAENAALLQYVRQMLGMASDADERPMAGQQYAMANKLPVPGMGGITAEIDQQAGGGFGRGASVPGPSRRSSPTPMSDAEYRSKHMELQQLKGAVMKLGPMREKLVELGATPEQMSKMDAAQAYKFIKERSPGGMGQVSPGWQDRNQEFIDRIRSMQDELTGAWQSGKAR